MLNYEANIEVIDYLKKTPIDMPGFVKMFKHFYDSCREKPEFVALDSMQWLAQEENMKRALLTPNDCKDVDFDWHTILVIFRKYDLNGIFLRETISYHVLELLLLLAGCLAVVRGTEDYKTLNLKQRSILMDSLDKDYTPCSNFLQYACYKWSDHHEDTRDNFTTVADMLNYEANIEVIDYLKKTSLEVMPGFVKMFKYFYDSCMEKQEFVARDYMHWLEREENMKWALLTPNDNKDVVFDWPTTLAIFRKYGFNDIFLKEAISYQDANKFMIYLSKPFEETFRFINNYNMEEYNSSIPLPQGTMDFMKLWEIVDKFEDKLNEIKVVEKQEKIFKFSELPYPWLKKYLTVLMKPQDVANMQITIDNIPYLEALDSVLKEYDNIFLVRYLELRFIHYLEMANKRDTPNECMTNAKSLMPMAHEWIYGHIHPELLQEMPKIRQMFENIVKNINKTLHMDKYGFIPQAYFRILETIQLKIGNLPQENAKELLDQYYANLKLTPNNYYGNYLSLLKFYFQLQHSYFDYGHYGDNLAANKEFFFKSPMHKYDTDIHPEYYPSMNLLIIPLSLLRTPVYHVGYEDIFKQSSLGTLMGIGIFEGFTTVQVMDREGVHKLAGVVGLHAAFEIFFSSLQADDISRYQTMFSLSSLKEIKQMFFLNAIHYYCEWYPSSDHHIDFAVGHLTDFTETYDCKLNAFLKMF
ncbi:uncharacterized protein LOC133331114 [Musca vetustissima]|uniref:uncharacterized protein LOC133331114 n=1 Tax=Musca vetustissima TaxID=27455 RepID=UPI002AB62C57|nr:uncharacterized protein LOC133331114 [Musca vetustissima]